MTKKEVFGLIFFFGLMAYGIFGCDQPKIEEFTSNDVIEYRTTVDTATTNYWCEEAPCEQDSDPVPFKVSLWYSDDCCAWSYCRYTIEYTPSTDVNVSTQGRPIKFGFNMVSLTVCEEPNLDTLGNSCCNSIHEVDEISRDSVNSSTYKYIYEIVGCCPDFYPDYCCEPSCNDHWWLCAPTSPRPCCTQLKIMITVQYESLYEEQMMCEWTGNLNGGDCIEEGWQ